MLYASKMSLVMGFICGQEPTPEFDQPEHELGELGDLLGMEPLAKLLQQYSSNRI